MTPGFSPERQSLVVELMRLNLIATLIFSISGLVIAGLQANQHFLFPAMAPIFYNIGQIIGILFFAPKEGITIGSMQLPTLGLGEKGMVYGVILGAVLHLSIQIPGLIKHKFSWTPRIDLKDEDVRKVLRMLGPRLATMFFIQLTPIFRDVFASYLSTGSITALKNGWSIMQVPETLIGTAIGTAILPTLSEQFVKQEREKFPRIYPKGVSRLNCTDDPGDRIAVSRFWSPVKLLFLILTQLNITFLSPWRSVSWSAWRGKVLKKSVQDLSIHNRTHALRCGPR